MLKTIYIGSDQFSSEVLRTLAETKSIEISAVVTYSDIEHGRGRRKIPTPVKIAAKELSIPVIEIDDVNDPIVHQKISDFDAPAALLLSFKILPVNFLRIFPKGIINLHPSLLPDLRGAAPVNWAIIRGYKKTGLSTFIINEKVDFGNILMQKTITIHPNETAGELFKRMVTPAAELFARSLELYLNGKITPQPQPDVEVNNAPRIKQIHRSINWNKSAREIHNRIRGLSPTPGAIANFKGKQVKIYRTTLLNYYENKKPGEIALTKDGFSIACGEGALGILEIQPESKVVMSGIQFANGYIKSSNDKFD